MILIEIFDKEDFRKNIYGALFFNPEKVIYIHHNDAKQDHLEGLEKLLKTKKPSMKKEFISVNLSDFSQLDSQILCMTEDKENIIYLEICGGDEVANIYLKEICEKREIKIISIDHENQKIIEWCQDEIQEKKISIPKLKFKDILCLHGGIIKESFHETPLQDRFPKILSCSKYVFEHDFAWTRTNVYFQRCIGLDYFQDIYKLEINSPLAIKDKNNTYRFDFSMMYKLKKCGFLNEFFVENDKAHFKFSDSFSKSTLLTKGIWLELFLYITARKSQLFSEVYMSVRIDWNKAELQNNVTNEIDIILMKNNIPIFISCKMTKPDTNSLNELKVYAEEFAGYNAKKIIATTSTIEENSAFYNRCKELEIEIIDHGMLTEIEINKFYNQI